MKRISITVPTYNEEENIEYAYSELIKVMKKIPRYDYEIIFVDNLSRDTSRDLIRKIAKKDKKVIGIFLSRNFTAEYSSQAAMKMATGNALITMDCDLQDPPSLIPQFVKEWEKGVQVVIGVRKKINDTPLMTLIRKSFYVVFQKLANIEMPLDAGSFCLMDRKVLDVINALPERNRFFRGLRAWVGFRTVQVEYERKGRKFGSSKNNIFDYIKDSQRGLLGFSFIPLDVMTTLGFILTFLSFIFLLGYLILVLVVGNPIRAQIPILLAIVFFGSIQMLALSIVGKYIQIIFEEVKQRPTYIIDEIINGQEDIKK